MVIKIASLDVELLREILDRLESAEISMNFEYGYSSLNDDTRREIQEYRKKLGVAN